MKYAVVTACLNSARTIRRTIQSVMCQSILPTEYIFVDGGSRDNTLDIIDEEIKISTESGDITSFKVVKQMTKGGIYEAWNLAFYSMSDGIDYVFILNSDDWYELNCAEIVHNTFSLASNIDIVVASDRKYKNQNIEKGVVGHNRSFLLFPILMPIVHPACFIKKNVYDKIGLFNQGYRVSGDYEFLYRCYKNNFVIKKCTNVLVNREMGGWADSNKILARRETLMIGKQYSKLCFIPQIAYLLRKLFNL